MRRTIKHDSPAFLDVSADLLEQGYAVRFRASGTSMRPAIRDGQAIRVEPINPDSLRKGDVVLFRHRERPLAHRVVDIRYERGRVVDLVVRGDNKAACDAPISAATVLGKVVVENWRTRVRRYVLAKIMGTALIGR